MNNIQKQFAILLLFISQISFATVQFEQPKSVGIFDAMSYQEVVEVNLKMNIEEVIANRRNTEKHLAQLTFNDENGMEQSWDIKVNLRGKFRRVKCAEMPPLKLNFKKSELEAKGLGKFDDLKLVTHCVENEQDAKELLVKEYLAYKLFNQLTENSFRVQILKINYIDINSDEKKQHWGVLIEDTAQMRKRIGAEKIESAINAPRERYDVEALKMVALYQYMIGNFDWDINAIRNIKVVQKEGKYFAIPYDFDFSMMVNAPYAMINPAFNIVTNEDRVYLGFEKDIEAMEDVKALFISKKKIFYGIIKDCKLLKGSTRRGLIQYLNSFYKNIDTINLIPNKELLEPNGQ